jgi:hypothetical protein
MLLDLPGPALRLLTDVADFRFSDITSSPTQYFVRT